MNNCNTYIELTLSYGFQVGIGKTDEAIENYQCDQWRNSAKELQFVVKQQNFVGLRSWVNSKNR